MAGSLNMVQLVGNLGKDPDIRSMTSGDRVANFSMAMGESWKDKSSGEKRERTEWVNVVVWGDGLVGVIEKYVHKGSKIYVQGQIRTRKYEKDGSDRYATEVVVQGMGGKLLLLGDGPGERGGDGNQSRHERPAQDQGGGYSSQNDGFAADLDDEIPF